MGKVQGIASNIKWFPNRTLIRSGKTLSISATLSFETVYLGDWNLLKTLYLSEKFWSKNCCGLHQNTRRVQVIFPCWRTSNNLLCILPLFSHHQLSLQTLPILFVLQIVSECWSEGSIFLTLKYSDIYYVKILNLPLTLLAPFWHWWHWTWLPFMFSSHVMFL